MKTIKDITEEQLNYHWGAYIAHYFAQVLSGEVSIETAQEDILSLMNCRKYAKPK